MTRRNAAYLGTVIIAALLLCGFSCVSYAKAGQLAKDFAASVLVAEQVEIAAANTGFIEPAMHKSMQQEFLQLADAGVRLDAAINQAHSVSGAAAEISVINKLLTDLSQNKVTGIKDPKTQLALKTALLTTQTIIDEIAAFGGK